MRTFGIIVLLLVLLGVVYAGYMMVDVDQTQEARLPDVSIEGGQAPEYNVRTGNVEMAEEEVTVPSVDIQGVEENETDTTRPIQE
jgi:hypothetical protein